MEDITQTYLMAFIGLFALNLDSINSFVQILLGIATFIFTLTKAYNEYKKTKFK